MNPACTRSFQFAQRLGLRMPVLMAPMAGVPSVPLAAAVATSGGMASLGALLMDAVAIADWVARFRAATAGVLAHAPAPLQINLWVPDPPPVRNPAHEAAVRTFVSRFGPPVAPDAGDAPLQDFEAQCRAVLQARPTVVSSIMGVFPAPWVAQFRAAGIVWMATVTSVAEARAAAAAGADVIVAQGSEAGGHRGAFDAQRARDAAVGLFALLPQVVDAVSVPVVATGGIADARGVAAALLLGASAVQVGSALLRCPEAAIAPVWAHGLQGLAAEDTRLTRAFSGRWGRAVLTDYVRDATAPDAPEPAPYPVQRGITAAMRKDAEQMSDLQRMQAWAGQGVGLVKATQPAQAWLQALWADAQTLLG